MNKILKKSYISFFVAALLALTSMLTGCQQEPCVNGQAAWFGVQIVYRDTIRTNLVQEIRGKGKVEKLPIVLGKNGQYLLPLNPTSDSCGYQFLFNGAARTTEIRINYTRTPTLISESCGLSFKYEGLNVLSDADSAILTSNLADTTRKTNLILWLR